MSDHITERPGRSAASNSRQNAIDEGRSAVIDGHVPSPVPGRGLDARRVASLQGVIGNRAVLRMVAKPPPIQAKEEEAGTSESTRYWPPKRVSETTGPLVARRVAQHSLGAAHLIRRAIDKQQITGTRAFLRKGTFRRTSVSTGKEIYTVKDDKLATLNQGDVVNVDTDKVGRMSSEPSGTYPWVWAEKDSTEGFLRETRLGPIDRQRTQGMMVIQSGFKPSAQQEQNALDEASTDNMDPGGVGTMFSVGGSSTGSMSEGLESQYLKQVDSQKNVVDNQSMKGSKTEGAKTNLDIASGTFDAVGGIFGFAMAVRTLMSTKADTFDKIIGAISLVENASKVVSGTGKIVEGAGKLNGAGGDTMKTMEMFSKVTGVVTDGLGAIKGLFDAIFKVVKHIKNADKMSGGSHFKSVVDIVKTTLEATAGTVKMVKGIIDAAGGAISVGLTNALPGLGIAIGAATLAIQGYNLGKSWLDVNKVREIETGFRTKLEANLSPSQAKRYMKDVKGKKVVDKSKMASRKASLLQKIADPTIDDTLRARYQGELDAINEFEMVNEMKHIGMKRRTRAGLHIFTAMSSIAGDIATLSGVGAVAGAPLKIFSSGFEGGMVGFRKLKQFGRDRGWKGFNSEKSTKNKKSKRLEHAKLLMTMVGKLPVLPPETSAGFASVKAQYKQMETLLRATGVDLEELYSHNQAPDGAEQQFNILVKAMAERE